MINNYEINQEKERWKVQPNSKLFSLSATLLKRVFDLFTSLVLIPLFLPVILLISVIICIESTGNPFFIQRRIGQHGNPFIIFKFRTLYVHHFGLIADEEEPADYRIPPFGKVLRRTKLDELPQLLNILLGRMSFIGPRPHTPNEFDFSKNADANRLLAKPGLTGVSQISGNKILSKPNIAWMDIWYINNYSFMLDIRILFYTITAIIRGEKSHYDPMNLHRFLS